ncbi:MAG: molybdopterin dinucleotide binding domain-containing protein [Planctomycetota bacterium]
MERAGWWAPGYRTEEELWTRIQETGGWWDPFYDHWHWNRVFQTGSGRFEFRPDLLAELDRKRRLRSEALRGERPGETASPGESLALHLFEPLPLAGGIGAELPFLQEILDPGLEERWETWVEIHPGTAKSLGLNDGDKVAVSSAHGSIRARLRTTRRVVPGVAAIPVGQGKRAAGRWARDRGANPLEILSPAREALSRLPDLGATLVRVVVEKGEAGSGPERRGA